ncbi:YaaR family protein [uncultured Anaerovibrio sp.]|uniref:YaaR family protein n=1 Tax=uncultured Anaerovibrio sp. TaxID=361586 RepID=UPI00261A74FA|nr:YaaR family protein [uncultured Anaerovibrio sp.]
MPAMGSSSNRKTNAMESDFSSEFEDQRSSASHEQLQRLLEQIDEQGSRLTKTPTYDELMEYRSLIKNFVSTVVGQMYDVSTQSGWDRMGRQKVYTTVRKIDTELENMAEKIRLGQSDQLDVVASHDAIRGMLVDLYM